MAISGSGRGGLFWGLILCITAVATFITLMLLRKVDELERETALIQDTLTGANNRASDLARTALSLENDGRTRSSVLQAYLAHDPLIGALLLAENIGQEEPPGGLHVALDLAQLKLPLSVIPPPQGLSVTNQEFDAFSVDFNFEDDRIWLVSIREPQSEMWIWASDGTETLTVPHDSQTLEFSGAQFSPDGSVVLVETLDDVALIYPQRGTGTPITVPIHPETGAFCSGGCGLSSIQISPDSSWFATTSWDNGGQDRFVQVFALSGTDGPTMQLGGTSLLAFSPEGDRVVSAGEDGTITLRSMDGSVVSQLGRVSGRVEDLAFGPDGVLVAAASDTGVHLFSVDRSIEATVASQAVDVEFGPDGLSLAVASEDGGFIWNIEPAGERPLTDRNRISPLWEATDGVVFDSTGNVLFTLGANASLWNVESNPTEIFRIAGYAITTATFAPDGSLVTGSPDGTGRVWSVDPPTNPLVIPSEDNDFNFSPDGTMVSVGVRGGVEIWTTDGTSQVVQVTGSNPAFSSDGSRIATASRDGSIRVRQIDGTGEPIEVFGPTQDTAHIAFSPDDLQLAAAFSDGSVWVLSLEDPSVILRLRGLEPQSTPIFSPLGRRLAVPTRGGLQIWTLEGDIAPVTIDDRGALIDLAFNHDGSRLLTVFSDSGVSIWSTADLEELTNLPSDQAAFSPAGSHVISATDANTAHIWPIDNAENAVVLRGHTGMLLEVAFSSTGDRVFTASWDGQARIWSSDGRGVPIVLPIGSNHGWEVAFSPEGSRIAAWDGRSIEVWTVDWDSLLVAIRASTEACLTPDQRSTYLSEAPENAVVAYENCQSQFGNGP